MVYIRKQFYVIAIRMPEECGRLLERREVGSSSSALVGAHSYTNENPFYLSSPFDDFALMRRCASRLPALYATTYRYILDEISGSKIN